MKNSRSFTAAGGEKLNRKKYLQPDASGLGWTAAHAMQNLINRFIKVKTRNRPCGSRGLEPPYYVAELGIYLQQVLLPCGGRSRLQKSMKNALTEPHGLGLGSTGNE